MVFSGIFGWSLFQEKPTGKKSHAFSGRHGSLPLTDLQKTFTVIKLIVAVRLLIGLAEFALKF